MAIWNFLPCFDTGLTYTSAYKVGDNGNTLNIGEVWYIDDGFGTTACGIVDSVNTTGLPFYLAQSLQNNCFDCYNNNGGAISIQDCTSLDTYDIPIDNFGFVPQIRESYNLTVTTSFGTTVGCFTIVDVFFPGSIPGTSAIVNSGPFANCIECNGGVGTLYVETCLGGFNTYYVELTGTIPPLGTIVSITPLFYPLDVICAEVVGYSTNVADATLNNNYGVVNCEICIEENATKRYIVSCLGGGTEVIWTNPFLNVGDIISVNTRSSTECYQISGETTDNITLSGVYGYYLPLPSCEACISCNGYTFLYGVCSDLSQEGYVSTYQYIPINGVFLHPISGCCQVIEYTNSLIGNREYFQSFYTFEDCPTCTASTANYQSWFAVPCSDGQINVITTPIGYTSNSVLLSYVGIVPLECSRILTEFIPDPFMYSSYVFGITNEIVQTDCTTCQNDLTVGVGLAECGTTNVQYRNVNYNDYILILYSYELILRSDNGQCYLIVGFDCFVPPNYTPINIIDTFNTCTECITYLPPPISAGTEYSDCQICFECTTGETINSVSTPHPQWTSPQGTLITLLDAVQLGGTNGLNN